MRHIVAIISALIAVVALPVTIAWVMQWGRFAPPPLPPLTKEEVVQKADETIARVRLDDLAVAIADDGEGSDELQTFVGHAYLNTSAERGNLSIAQIFNEKLILSAPSEEKGKLPRFIMSAWTGNAENLARAQKEAVRLLTVNNRQEDWKARPCLRAVTKVIRPKKFGTWQSVGQMEQDGLVLLYENTAEKTKFYGPPGSPTCNAN